MRGAFLEVAADTLGSVAVLISAVVILATGWQTADPIASLVIGLMIVPRTVKLLRETLDVLLESVDHRYRLRGLQSRSQRQRRQRCCCRKHHTADSLRRRLTMQRLVAGCDY